MTTPDNLYEIGVRILGTESAPGGGVDVNNIGPGAGGSFKSNRKEGQEKENNSNLEELKKTGKGYLRSTLGIQVGVAALLKQSQIFTGVLGTIFQILGAMVDVVLAAFMPLIIPALKTMANSVPQIQQKAEEIREWVERAVAWLETLGERIQGQWWYKYVKQAVTESLQYVIIGFFVWKVLPIWATITNLWKYGIMSIVKWLTGIYNNTIFNKLQMNQGNSQMPPGWGWLGDPPGTSGPTRWDRTKNRMGMYSSRGGAMMGGWGSLLRGAGRTAWGAMEGGGGRAATYSAIGGGIGLALGAAGGPGGMMLGSIIGTTAGGLIANMLGNKMDEARERHKLENADVPNKTRKLFGGLPGNPAGGFNGMYQDA